MQNWRGAYVDGKNVTRASINLVVGNEWLRDWVNYLFKTWPVGQLLSAYRAFLACCKSK